MAQRPLRARIAGHGFEIKSTFAAGAAADTNITITGINIGDEVIGAYEVVPHPAVAGAANVLKTSLTAEIKITAANTIQCDTTNTTGNQILIFWIANPK